MRVRRFACTTCRRLWRQDSTWPAEPRVRLTHQAVVWGLRAQGVEYLSVAVAWHTASTSILTRTWQTIAGDLDRLEGVHTLGVDVPAARFTIKREVPPLRSDAPRHAPVAPVRRTRGPRRRPPHRLGPRCPARAQQPVHGCSDGDVGGAVGDLVVGAGPWARIAPGVDHGEGTPPKARARRPLDGPGAHRVGDLRGSFPRSGPHRSWTPGGGGYRAPSCPRRTS